MSGKPADGIAASGAPIHFRIAKIDTAAGPVTITASGPRDVAERPLRQAIVPLLASLLILGFALIAAIFLQLRFGLRPLRGLEASLADVRRGTARHIPTQQPLELRGVVAELNALIDRNAIGLDNARRHVANLGHGLKTPLATLQVRLEEEGNDHTGQLRALTQRMEASIRHHLSRARAASPGGPVRQTSMVKAHMTELISALSKIHANRARDVHINIPVDLKVACDPQDLAEMLGNLLDNAWRWAATSISVAVTDAGTMVALTISDDGPGLLEAGRADALVAGRRLDESGSGHGFGLSITRELAELYGGALLLDRASSGGLAATLTLPRIAS